MTSLFLNHDTDYDWLIALEHGRVDDGVPAEHWHVVDDGFAYVRDAPDGRCIGFRADSFSEFDPEDLEIWGDPLFDAPAIGLTNASAGEIALAAKAFFDGTDSINRVYLAAAVDADGDEAVELWRQCLQCGDAMAHYGLGYTLFDLGRYIEAYRHLRYYTEIAPANPWNWHWLGQAAEALGEKEEARRAFQRTLDLDPDDETDAFERLQALG